MNSGAVLISVRERFEWNPNNLYTNVIRISLHQLNEQIFHNISMDEDIFILLGIVVQSVAGN